MSELSYLDFVEQQYIALRQAKRDTFRRYAILQETILSELDEPDFPDDYGILPGPEGGDAFDPWVLGFVDTQGIAL